MPTAVDVMQVLVPHEVIVARARKLLVGMPRHVRGHDAKRCAGGGITCIEPHLLGNGTDSWYSNDEPLEGVRYDILADYDLHAGRYVRVYASFPRPLMRAHTVDVSEALHADSR